MIEFFFKQCGLTPPTRITLCSSFDLARTLVQSTHALSVLARPLIDHTRVRHGIRAIPVREPMTDLPVSTVTRRGAVPTPAARLLLDTVRAAAAAWS